MSDALYGLVGALGGAVIAAAVAYWGPLHQARESAERARREGERQREAEHALAQLQLDASRAEADEARGEVARQEKIRRLIAIRSALREWQEVLDQAVQQLWNGVSVDVQTFDEAEQAVRYRAWRAMDEVMYDQWFIPQSAYGAPPDADRSTSYNVQVASALKDYANLIRETLLSGSQVGPDRMQELMRRQAASTERRSTMSNVIESRVRSIQRNEGPGPAWGSTFLG